MSKRSNRPLACIVIAVGSVSLALSSCGEADVKCSTVGDAYSFIGTVTEHHGNHAEFSIEKMRPSSSLPPPADAPALAAGARVRVHYDGSTAQFLHTGTRYVVGVWWMNREYWSDIHTADQPCSGRTVYASGAAINTSLWARSSVRKVVYALLLGLTLAITLVLRNTYRVRRRRRARAGAS